MVWATVVRHPAKLVSENWFAQLATRWLGKTVVRTPSLALPRLAGHAFGIYRMLTFTKTTRAVPAESGAKPMNSTEPEGHRYYDVYRIS